MRFPLRAAAIALAVASAAFAAELPIIKSVTVNRSYINPVAGEEVELLVSLTRAGRLNVVVIDRDGYLIRELARDSIAAAGANAYRWNGRGADGRPVPDEAYSFKVDWIAGADHATYFPANHAEEMQSIDAHYYSGRTATLSYTLPVASRVHLQAGVAVKNPRTGEMEGPVLKTIVNREPRIAGRVAENWTGFDESGAIYVPDFRDFVVSIAATPLPENSVVTVGNREQAFIDWAAQRQGSSLFTFRVASHHQHAGLSVFEDLSPALRVEPMNATWSEREKIWLVRDRRLKLKLTPVGPSAAVFQTQPGDIYRFLDQKLIGRSTARRGPVTVEVAVAESSRSQNVSINWRSEYGAVAANTIRIRRVAPAARSDAAGGAGR